MCPARCLSCTNATTCTSCVGSIVSQRVVGNVCACPSTGYYDGFVAGAPVTYDCTPCITNKCMTCTSNSSICDSCYSATRVLATNCECPVAGYQDIFQLANNLTYDCVPCLTSLCYSCNLTSYLVCDSCNGNYRAVPSCQCLTGYYSVFNVSDNSTWDCLACPAECASCTSASSCMSCQGAANLTSSRAGPLCSCPQGSYSIMPTNANCSSNTRSWGIALSR